MHTEFYFQCSISQLMYTDILNEQAFKSITMSHVPCLGLLWDG